MSNVLLLKKLKASLVALDSLDILRVYALRRGDTLRVVQLDYQRARIGLRRANWLYGKLGRAHALANLNRARARLQLVTREQLTGGATPGRLPLSQTGERHGYNM